MRVSRQIASPALPASPVRRAHRDVAARGRARIAPQAAASRTLAAHMNTARNRRRMDPPRRRLKKKMDADHADLDRVLRRLPSCSAPSGSGEAGAHVPRPELCAGRADASPRSSARRTMRSAPPQRSRNSSFPEARPGCACGRSSGCSSPSSGGGRGPQRFHHHRLLRRRRQQEKAALADRARLVVLPIVYLLIPLESPAAGSR